MNQTFPMPPVAPSPAVDRTGPVTAPVPPAPPVGLAAGRGRRSVGAGILVVAVAVAGATGAGVATLLDEGEPAVASAAPVPGGRSSTAPTLAGPALDVAGVVAAVGPSVVTIQIDVDGRPGGAGTGVVLDAEGEILTNAHVVEGASAIRVTVEGRPQSIEARLVAADRGADLALLQLEGTRGLHPARLGSSGDLAVGDDVVAIGNALGLRGGPTVTRGIVSALDRSLDTGSGTMTGLLQTDASISSGNSGGPLVDARGRVVGINTAVATSGGGRAAENIGFAIAVDRALPILERLRSGEAVPAAGQLGVAVEDPVDGSRGAVLRSVAPGSAADAAGLREGDLVVAVDDVAVDGAAALVAAVRVHAAGDAVSITVERDGDERTLQATLRSPQPS